MSRTVVTIGLWMGICAAMVQVVEAQDRNERRRQFFEGVLRTLVESQIDRQPDSDIRPPDRPGVRNPQLATSLQTLERFSDESGHLLAALRREDQANPAYRSLLGDVVRIKASTDVLMRRGPNITTQQFATEYQTIDRQWRVVSHRLKQIPNFDRGCLAHVDKLNLYDQQICELLNLAPQVDRFELSRQVAILRVSLQTLLEDLEFELRRQPGGAALLLEGQKLETRVDRLGHVVAENGPHQVIVAEYQQVYGRWRGLVNQLRTQNDRYITRRIQRIEATHESIHELLWIPKAIDRAELLALLKTLQRDISYLHEGITLDHLLQHPQPEAAVASAATINAACGNLIKSLGGQSSLDELIWDFRLLEVEWQSAANQFAGWNEVEIDHRLAAAQQTMEVLSHTLGQELTIDHDEVVTLVASIHEAADALAAQTARLVNQSNQYPVAFRAAAAAATREFQDTAHHLHESLARHASDDHLRRDCQELVASWDRVKKTVAEFSPQHRNYLNQICRPLDPRIAKTQILYGF